MHVGIRRLTLRATQCHSLKEKRALLRKLEGRVRAQFHVPLAEVGAQDDWQHAILGYAVVGSDRIPVERLSAAIARFIEHLGMAEVVHDEHEITAYGDDPLGDEAYGESAYLDPESGLESEDPMSAEWIPASWKTEEGAG